MTALHDRETSAPRPWPGCREQALDRLDAFVPQAGRAYAAKRNYDYGAGRRQAVSQLSPWIRHRVISEAEVAGRVLSAHGLTHAEKFIQEICWRTYWKGWLEQHPQVWSDYLVAVRLELANVDRDPVLSKRLSDALAGRTGIGCFDAWVGELKTTGYLHNHARMWFASIWIFTLELPWVLGADFFLRHLLDADPASNTLSWRWVGGLQTVGKTYLARAGNIETYTLGRFRPEPGQLAQYAEPLSLADQPAPRKAIRPATATTGGASVIALVTEDDVGADHWPLGDAVVAGIALAPLPADAACAPAVLAFKRDVMEHAASRLAAHFQVPARSVSGARDLIELTASRGAGAVVTHYRPIGFSQAETDAWIAPVQQAGLAFLEVQRAWDRAFWPHAKAGYFKLKEKIPAVLRELGLADGG